MKKKLLGIMFCFAAAFSLSLGAFAKLSMQQNDYLLRVESINQQAIRDLKIQEKNRTGDLDLEYLKHLKSHYKLTIQYAQNEIQYGANDKMISLAQDIVKNKKETLKQIETLLKALEKEPREDVILEASYLATYEDIYQKLVDSIRPREEAEKLIDRVGVDRHFLGCMITQHEFGLRLTSAVRAFTKSEKILELASELDQQGMTRLEKLYETANTNE